MQNWCRVDGRNRRILTDNSCAAGSAACPLRWEPTSRAMLACYKVAVDACFLSSRIYCAGSGRVS